MSQNQTPSHPSGWNYEVTITKIEKIIAELESGNLPLEQVFAQFAIAVEDLQACDRFLQQGKEQIDLLIETLPDDGEEEF